MVPQVTLQKQIIQKLYIHSYIGAKHTSEENIPKNFPKHLKGQAKKELQQLKTKNNKLFRILVVSSIVSFSALLLF
jgi:hypothetical protein